MSYIKLILILTAINKLVFYSLILLTFAICKQTTQTNLAKISVIQNADLIKIKRVSKNTLYSSSFVCELDANDYFVVKNDSKIYIYAKHD